MSILDKIKSITSSLTGVPQSTDNETLISKIESGKIVIDKTSKDTAVEDANNIINYIGDEVSTFTVAKVGQPEIPYADALVNYMACGRITDSNNVFYRYGRIEGVGSTYYWDCFASVNSLSIVIYPSAFIIFGRVVRFTAQETVYSNTSATSDIYGCLCIKVDLSDPSSQYARVYVETATGSYPIVKLGDNLISVEGGIATIVIGKFVYYSSTESVDYYDTAPVIKPGHADSSYNISNSHSINGKSVSDLINSEGVFYFCDYAQKATSLLNAIKANEMLFSYGESRELCPVSYLGSSNEYTNDEGYITSEKIITLSNPFLTDNIVGIRFFMASISSTTDCYADVQTKKRTIVNTFAGSTYTTNTYFTGEIKSFDKTVFFPNSEDTMSIIDWKYSNFICQSKCCGDPLAEKNIDTDNGYSLALFVSEYGSSMSSKYSSTSKTEGYSTVKLSQVELLGMNGAVNQIKITVYRYITKEKSISYSSSIDMFSVFRNLKKDSLGSYVTDDENSLRFFIQPIYKTN